MLQGNEILDRTELGESRATQGERSDALNIEEVVRCAHQIHRQHGGIFGYDFDDWVLAWGAATEASEQTEFESADELNAAVRAGHRGEVSDPCLGFGE
jgi:hypothetical protein